ncbi:hypothetical protein FA513_29745 [Pseudomonas aeruginosa]|nr:hypothetical protein [Pseudomonas aeruginosa]MDV6623971.1 hypothetical protein [Pseudomonas aeruginosa]
MGRAETELIRTMKMNVREIAWLWNALSNDGIDFDECQLNSQVMRKQIAEHLTPKLVAALEHAKDTQFLAEDDFRWVAKDGRQPAWLVRKTLQAIGEILLPQPLATLPIRQQVIAVFDLWNARLSEKRMALSDLEYAWREHLQHDKLFTWFKGEDEESKCSMAWDWMEKHQPQLTRSVPPFTCHSELMDFFDRRDATPGERELYVAKIKRWWGTRKTRENSPNKKQYNFVLANDVNTALDKLAQGHKLSRTKILERLILNEAETGLHLGQVLRKL